MDVTPTKKTIGDLLKSKRFVVPRFQREYSWEKSHYKEFFEDIVKSLSFKDGKLKSESYFLGTMLFIGDLDSGEAYSEAYVVDGQQRLTTITILFSALAQSFREIGKNELAEKVFEYVMGMDNNAERFRILRSETSYPFLSDYIQRLNDRVDLEPSKEEDIALKEAYDYFQNVLQESNLKKIFSKVEMAIPDNTSYLELLQVIRDQLVNCVVITLHTKEREQANKIFEILNAKGKSLTDIDLIKNQIFAVLDEEEPSDFARDKWKDIKEKLYIENEMNGLAEFFRHYWESKYGTVSKNKMYSKFLDGIQKNKNVYKDFLADLVKNAEYYRKCISPSLEQYDNRQEYMWLVQSLKVIDNFFGVVQTRVVLMALMDCFERGNIALKDIKYITQYLEQFHFVYTAICSQRPNRLERIYSNAAIAFRKGKNKNDVKRAIKDILVDKLEDIYPDKDDFYKGFIKLLYSNKNREANLKAKYVIKRINMLYSGKEIFDEDGSIEHIIPENNGEQCLNIGNLILLEKVLNEEAGEKSYSDKIAVYGKSNYSWVKEFVKKYSHWSAEDISVRSVQLAEIYYSRIICPIRKIKF